MHRWRERTNAGLVQVFMPRHDEREMVSHFGDAYREYQRRLPRFLPRLGRLRLALAARRIASPR